MDNRIAICPLCKTKVPESDWDDNRIFQIECKVCGTYRITDRAAETLADNGPHFDLSGVVRLRHESKQRQLVTRDNYQDLISSAPSANDVPAKLRYLLRHIARNSEYPGDAVELERETDFPLCFGASVHELFYFAKYAEELQFVADDGTTRGSYRLTLTPQGWEEVNRIPTLESSTAFVAMSFSKDALLRQAWEQAIKPALEDDAGYKAVRIDHEEYLGDIVFEFIARIKESRFVIADVTQHKNGVYFEGGYAMGMGLPVIWMCCEKDLANTHFDTSHLNHIVWSDVAELRKNLANRILATIGYGLSKRIVAGPSTFAS